MVAVVKSGYSLHRILNYNENKVKEQVAQCIWAGNFPLDPEQMSFTTKFNLMRRRMEMYPGKARSSIHISLNFHPKEKQLSDEKLQAIAADYMSLIGFDQQPFLVYRHDDAGHPHIHIVTTNVKADGTLIKQHNIGALKSEPARKAIEKKYDLIPADHKDQTINQSLDSATAARVVYGKTETKRAIQNVLENVFNHYRYTSLAEYSAVLKLYNVTAERGSEDSRVFQHRGLLYKLLDGNGQPVGVPIKASVFYNQPTLAKLEESFPKNELARLPFKTRLKNSIDRVLLNKPGSLNELVAQLEKQGISVVLRQSTTGELYGLTYIDHKTKCVFNGSELGKNYSAKAIKIACGEPTTIGPHEIHKPNSELNHETGASWFKQADPPTIDYDKSSSSGVLETLLQNEYTGNQLPAELRGKKRRRPRRKRKL